LAGGGPPPLIAVIGGAPMKNLELMTLAELNADIAQLGFDLNYGGLPLPEFRAKTRAMNQSFIAALRYVGVMGERR
jgi:hypothetical protein